MVDPGIQVPDLNREGQDLLLEVVDLKREVSDLRSCGIRPNLTRSYVPSPRLRVSLTPSAWQRRRASSACATMTSSLVSLSAPLHFLSLQARSHFQYNTISGGVIILLLQLDEKIHRTEYNIILNKLD